MRKMHVDASPRRVLGGGGRNADAAFSSASWEEREGLRFLPDRAALPALLPARAARAGRDAPARVVSVPAAGRRLYVAEGIAKRCLPRAAPSFPSRSPRVRGPAVRGPDVHT